MVGKITFEDEEERLQPPGWPERFCSSARVTFERPVGVRDAAWWARTFVETHGLFPEDFAERLSRGAPGEKSFAFEWIRAADESFALKMEGSEGNRTIWFHGSDLTVQGGIFKDAVVYQDRLDVALEHRGRRYAQAIMRPIVEMAELLGVTRLSLDAQDIGGYLWAAAGAVPKGSWTDIARAVSPRLQRLRRRGEITIERQDQVSDMLARGDRDPRLLWAIARLPDPVTSTHARNPMDPETISLGKELLIGVSWKGEFNLSDTVSRAALRDWLERGV